MLSLTHNKIIIHFTTMLHPQFVTTGLASWSAARPGRTLPPGKTRYPFYRRLGGPQDRYGRAENLVPTGILSRTVKPVVSRIPTELPGPRNLYDKKLKILTMRPRQCTALHCTWTGRSILLIQRHALHCRRRQHAQQQNLF